MTELRPLLAAYDAHRAAGRVCALATVVHVAGSAYRRPGARMLVTEDGQLTGSISGGCLEGDARRRAAQVLHRGRPALITYDSTAEDDAWHGTQQGCRGVVQLLVELLDPTRPDNPLELLRRAADSLEPVVLATVFGTAPAGPVGLRRLLLPQDPDCLPPPNPEALLDYLTTEAGRVLASGVSPAGGWARRFGPWPPGYQPPPAPQQCAKSKSCLTMVMAARRVAAEPLLTLGTGAARGQAPVQDGNIYPPPPRSGTIAHLIPRHDDCCPPCH